MSEGARPDEEHAIGLKAILGTPVAWINGFPPPLEVPGPRGSRGAVM